MHRGLDSASCLAVVILLAGCSSQKNASHGDAVLTAGYDSLQGHRASPDPAAAIAVARRTELAWRRELAKPAGDAPQQSFDNLSVAELRARLRKAATAHRFDVVSLALRRPQQLAPKIIVRTDDYRGLANSMPAILRSLDPRRRASSDAQGWRFEGFYFEARDRHNVPFRITFNFWRGRSGGGGQWARSEPLHPFDHL
jgi:hypothetical protein